MDHHARVDALDGLRGWAALSVVGFHFYAETFQNILPAPLVVALLTVFNGPVAVAVFFVLSGYVLTVGSWRSADKTAALRLVVKRHARLSIPILATTVIVALLLAAHLTFNLKAAPLVGRQDWLGEWLHFSPDPASVLAYAFGTVFLARPPQNYGPFLWTMTLELWFSYIILMLCILERRLYRPYLVLLAVAALALLTDHPVTACFPLGALLALARRDGYLTMVLSRRAAIVTVALALVAGVLLRSTDYDEQGNVIVGLALVSAALLSPDLTRLLSSPVSHVMGRLSFPIYLAQFPVLVSLTSGLIVAWGTPGPVVAAAIGAVSIAATLGLAALLLPAEWLAQWTGRQIARLAAPLVAAVASALSPASPSGRLRPAANR